MKKRYRIVTDRFLGYEVQERKSWWPFWIQSGFSNTHESTEDAEEYINRLKAKEQAIKKTGRIVKYID